MKIQENFPNRSPFDVCERIKIYTQGKTVCDLGCGAADLLEYMLTNNFCETAVGIEQNVARFRKAINAGRNYVIFGDMYQIDLPRADVYLIWFAHHAPYVELLKRIKNPDDCVIICFNEPQTVFSDPTAEILEQVEMIYYYYDESPHMIESLFDSTLKFDPKINKIFQPAKNKYHDLMGVRICGVYRFKDGAKPPFFMTVKLGNSPIVSQESPSKVLK
jgi:hypothetical protein